MLHKFAEALRLWCNNFVLIALIVLTVWLPGNLLGEYLIWHVPADDEFGRSFRVGAFIEGVFGAILALLYRNTSKRTYREAERLRCSMIIFCRLTISTGIGCYPSGDGLSEMSRSRSRPSQQSAISFSSANLDASIC